MAKQLLILRHGKSDWDADYRSDFDRPLAERGKKAAKRMAGLIEDKELLPGLIVSSPANRAISTARIMLEYFDEEIQLVEQERIYAASASELLWVVQGLPDDHERVMLVGHNPGFEELAGELCGRQDVVMKTASLAVVEIPAVSWAETPIGRCELLSLFHPKVLD